MFPILSKDPGKPAFKELISVIFCSVLLPGPPHSLEMCLCLPVGMVLVDFDVGLFCFHSGSPHTFEVSSAAFVHMDLEDLFSEQNRLLSGPLLRLLHVFFPFLG